MGWVIFLNAGPALSGVTLVINGDSDTQQWPTAGLGTPACLPAPAMETIPGFTFTSTHWLSLAQTQGHL